MKTLSIACVGLSVFLWQTKINRAFRFLWLFFLLLSLSNWPSMILLCVARYLWMLSSLFQHFMIFERLTSKLIGQSMFHHSQVEKIIWIYSYYSLMIRNVLFLGIILFLLGIYRNPMTYFSFLETLNYCPVREGTLDYKLYLYPKSNKLENFGDLSEILVG